MLDVIAAQTATIGPQLLLVGGAAIAVSAVSFGLWKGYRTFRTFVNSGRG